MHTDIGVAIPSRGPTLGLWATICSLEEAAKFSGKTVHYSVIRNGVPLDESFINLNNWLGDRCWFHHREGVLPPPGARNIAASWQDCDYIFFVDDHVIVPHDWFDMMLCWAEHGLAFSSYKTNQYRYYHFVPSKDLPTKGDYSRTPKTEPAYYCLSAPNGGFGMKCSTWNSLGGYEPWYETFGGEETDLAFKAHLQEIPVWMVSGTYYYHYSVRSKDRGYEKVIDEANYRKLWTSLGEPWDIVKRFTGETDGR